MSYKWDLLEARYAQLNEEICAKNLDQKKRAELQKKISIFSEVFSKKKELDALNEAMQATEAQFELEADSELKELFKVELEELKKENFIVEAALELLFYPPDKIDSRNVYLEVRAGTGGQEAALFAADLLKMYLQYAIKRNWSVEIIDESETSIGGFKEAVVFISGNNVFGDLKNESGVHRVQRVPATENSGRVHTSTASVVVLPEADEVEVNINPAELRIDYYRASGAGGQHVNKTDSAVRITHLPTGVVVACQDDRSQHKNKAKALKALQSKLLAHAQAERQSKESSDRKQQIGSGDRCEKIRTYNYPQNRVTDHQINLTLKKLDLIMQGELDTIIDSLKTQKNKKTAQDSYIYSL